MLNYKHLYYFREVATSGSIARASESLHLTPQTISGQLSLLEEALGVDLFQKNGRHLELTEAGSIALHYADDIFQLGNALEEALQHYPKGGMNVFRVGVSDVVPKSIAYQILEPAIHLQDKPIRIVCTEGKLDDLLAELAVHRLELVLADTEMPPSLNVRGFNHLLGSCGLSFFATQAIKDSLQGSFPQCLDNAPILVPSDGTSLRQKLRHWFQEILVYPLIVGDFDDSALMRAFGQAGAGIFIAPSALEESLLKETDIHLLGRTDSIMEQFYAISVERRITHPAIKAITTHAQHWLCKGSLEETETFNP
jgi:LysR family transcriptional activator of nhaA